MAVTGKTFSELTPQQQADMRDSMRGYKVYTALLTQTGTTAPNAIILENTLGWTPTWLYNGVGNYWIINWPHDIDPSKVHIIGNNMSIFGNKADQGCIDFFTIFGDYILQWNTYTSGGSPSDEVYKGVYDSMSAYFYLEICIYS